MIFSPNVLIFNLAFIGIKILLFLGILKNLKSDNKKWIIFRVVIYFLFDFVCLSFFYTLNYHA